MSPLAILLVSSFVTTFVSGFGLYPGYNNNNNGGGSGKWGGGQGGSGQWGSGQIGRRQGGRGQGDSDQWGSDQGGRGKWSGDQGDSDQRGRSQWSGGQRESDQWSGDQGNSDQWGSDQGGRGQWSSGQGDSDQWGGGSGQGCSGEGFDPWAYLNTARQQCVVPTPVDPSLLSWFFVTPTAGADLSIPYSNYYYKFSFAEMFESDGDLSGMNLKVRYDLNYENYYFVNFTGYGYKEIVINCTLVEVEGSTGSCEPVPQPSTTYETNLTMIDPAYAWAVYADETLGIVAAIFCFGEIDTGAASWAIYSRTGDKIDQLTLLHIYEIVALQYGLYWF